MTAADAGRAAKSRRVWLLRVAVSAVVLALIFHFVPVNTVVAAAKKIPPLLWLAALLLFLLGHAAAAAKWRLLIGPGVSFGQAFRAHLAGLGANLALPGVAGGDVVRAGLVYRLVDDRARLAGGSVADRLIDTLGLVMITAAGAWAAWRPGYGAAATGYSALAVAFLVAVVAVFALAPALDRALRARGGTGRLARIAGEVVRILADLARVPWRLAASLAISLAVQCLFVGINIAFARAVGLDVPAAGWFYAWAGAKIIAIAPISLGGLGVREASMAALLKPFGADAAAVVAVGLIWQTVLYASGAIGLAVQSLAPRAATARAGAGVPLEASRR